MKAINPRTVCKNQISLSIQDRDGTYSEPYVSAEVGFIKDVNGKAVSPPDSWREFAESGFPSNVYAFVPLALIEEFIKSNGGKQS